MVVHEFIGLYICNAHLTIEFEQFESLLSEFYTSQGNVDACVNRASFSKTLCRGPYTATNLENRLFSYASRLANAKVWFSTKYLRRVTSSKYSFEPNVTRAIIVKRFHELIRLAHGVAHDRCT